MSTACLQPHTVTNICPGISFKSAMILRRPPAHPLLSSGCAMNTRYPSRAVSLSPSKKTRKYTCIALKYHVSDKIHISGRPRKGRTKSLADNICTLVRLGRIQRSEGSFRASQSPSLVLSMSDETRDAPDSTDSTDFHLGLLGITLSKVSR
jgi:hypothetical protein